jgi:two-component system sensor histidine kinase KdpD
VFEQFYRVRGDGRRPPGIGLGLAICQGIVAAHGGSVWVEATPGGGATFVVRLPVAELHRDAPDPAISGSA